MRKVKVNWGWMLMWIGLIGLLPLPAFSWGTSHEKVRLSDISVLTLYNDKMTSGRRSAGVLELKCVGGDAGCTAFRPQVVQCYNRGSDGTDVQWECKTDMDNAYRFGRVTVSCEGFDYPDDPFILKGSCGLEYTLDLTKEGHGTRPEGQAGHNYYAAGGGGGGAADYGWKSNLYTKQSSSSYTITNVAIGIIIFIIIYAIYKTCIAPPAEDPTSQRSRTNDDYPDNQGGRAPPPGFRPGYSSQSDSSSGFYSGGAGAGGDSCGSAGGAQSSRAGGFWTGAATGGLLGYLFGQRNDGGAYQRQRTGYGFAGPSTSSSWGGGGGFSGGGSSGTRTASGFGGTSRR